MKLLLTAAEVAERLGISERLVIQMAKRNLIPAPVPRKDAPEISWFAQEIEYFLAGPEDF